MEISYPDDLPVSARREEITAALLEKQVVVVAGETGSGKTTQLPKMCLEIGRKMIGHTQPRRIAARTVAERLAEELKVDLGAEVGYAVRFTDRVSDETLVKVMTDGLLLAELRKDRQLRRYDTLIIDEAHERSLNIDFLLGFLATLLPRRPDLKLVITSATIDTARFAAHFSAPVIEVSGRNYPVEVRYRPFEEDADAAMCEAVAEAMADNPGDVLVFLPGERDIRDAADALRGGDFEILPLYSRLSAAEQHRVFRPHRGRRVVLATNVAETSLTVPGIRSVVDSGLARISRYSPRTKVQRLRIEPISQASADQRAGRCGRVAPGLCIRLYSEDDFAERPRYTDPEILRTNLASVVLQMADIGLGDVESFPFLEPPDRRSVADARRLLVELGAFDGDRITRLGRRIARLPVDPRLGRMILEAERLGCLREVTVIAAALSVQDPRERPAERRVEADELHARFDVPGSDFLSMVRLWDHVASLQAELSGNQFRKRCRAEMLNVMRLREWQDVAGQIRQAYRQEGVSANRDPAKPSAVHRALLAGLLSQIGMRDRARGDYQGARGSRWTISRASGQARRQPAWAMAGELVETERTWARNVAAIEPAWAEKAGAHLVKVTRSEPWWDPERGEAFVDERVSLFGLPVVSGRRVPLARLDPVAARSMFVEAIVEEDLAGDPPALEPLRRRLAAIAELEQRARTTGLRADDLAARLDQYIPGHVTGLRHLRTPLDVPFEALVRPGQFRLSDYPDELVPGVPLTYVYAPGDPDDGVTAHVGLAQVGQLDEDRLSWGIPGYRLELLTALVRLLPKATRRALGPGAAAAVLASAGPDDGPLLEVAAARLSSAAGHAVDLGNTEALPPYLFVRYQVSSKGRVLATGRNLRAVREAVAGPLREAIAGIAPEMTRHGARTWEFGSIPAMVERDGFSGYPALVDEGESVGLAILDSPRAQQASAWAGARRLLLICAPLPMRHLERRISNDTKLAVARNGRLSALIADAAEAVADDIIVAAGGPPTDAASFDALVATARRDMPDRVARVVTIAGGVIAAADSVNAAARRLVEARYQPAVEDISAQVTRLVRPGFVAATGTARLADLLRYLRAAGRRLERLPGDVRRDSERMATVQAVQRRYEALLDRLAGRAVPPSELAEARWMIEELRVSLWAQDLGTRSTVSPQKIDRLLSQLGA